MAIAVEETVVGGTASSASFTLTSWTPGSNELVILAVALRNESITVSPSGNGLTFVQIADVDNTQGQCGITVFRAMVASPSTGQITVTITGNSTPAAGVAMRFSGVDTTGTHGSGAVEASATDAGPAVDNNDMKLDVTTVTNNAWALGLGTHRGKTFTVPGGETGISINNSYGSGGDIASCSTWYESVATAGSTTVGADNDLDSDGDWCMVALSIKPYVAATAAFLGLLFEVGLIMGAVAAVPGVGQPMALRGTEVPGLRGWLAGRFRR